MRTIKSILEEHSCPELNTLKAPLYNGTLSNGVVLAVESMRHHTTDEGWQIQAGLESGGYQLCGYNLPVGTTDTEEILAKTTPGVVVVQDKREWDVLPNNFREPLAKFSNISVLQRCPDIFKVTVLKDAHRKPIYHMFSAMEIGCHAWLVYYNPSIVCHLAPYLRREHLIRTYHTLDKDVVPPYTEARINKALLSGAVSPAYPFRSRLVQQRKDLPSVVYHSHPGYNRKGTHTPSYLALLSCYKVAICTCSSYGYLLRKIIEASACGCVVITDLPSEEVVPNIDHNLVRVPPNIELGDLNNLIDTLCRDYNPQRQKDIAEKALNRFDYRTEGSRLVQEIERMRINYASAASTVS